MILPIEMVPNTSPPVFKWRQVVDTLGGKRVVDHQGTLPPTVERAVETLIGVTKQLLMENAGLEGQVKALTDRCANQAAIIDGNKGKASESHTATSTRRVK